MNSNYLKLLELINKIIASFREGFTWSWRTTFIGILAAIAFAKDELVNFFDGLDTTVADQDTLLGAILIFLLGVFTRDQQPSDKQVEDFLKKKMIEH
jgi:hypothetical protein